MSPFRPRVNAVEWYESLFLQMCSHILTHSKIANRRGLNGALSMDTAATRDLVQSYQRNVAVAFSSAEMKAHLSQGAHCVVLIVVQEHQFHSCLKDINQQQEVVLSATLRTEVRSTGYANYHVDVAIIRPTSTSPMDIAH
ncbi:hypothetical protein X970_05155 [Pseudomonas monteilii SB3101]|jgi:hypothetical protein|uniref:Uncharacterized protein n=1 Tax=Pseudomonas monteilii SB3101 TaxID=1435058 RepID=V9V8J3_9PSED|nr:hypothetical protein X969_05180 [Pseudomonas monteilii SB3078]AHC91032.1 hypothetical protein X970_05155 [Pseudomonas monteilii SB3101]